MMKPISFPYQILGILIGFLLEFLYARGFLNGIKCYQLNRNAYKKRKKGETFKEWLFYDRWKNEIPKIFLIYHFAILVIHGVGLLMCSLFYLLRLEYQVGSVIAWGVIIWDLACFIIIEILFWSPKRMHTPYERWIVKRRGQKPKQPK